MARISREGRRLLVAEALRNLQKPDVLQESELTAILEVRPVGDSYWRVGVGLQQQLEQAARQVVIKLEGVPRFTIHRDLLLAVLEGSSVAAFARSRSMSREYCSKVYWKRVTEFLTEELTGKVPA